VRCAPLCALTGRSHSLQYIAPRICEAIASQGTARTADRRDAGAARGSSSRTRDARRPRRRSACDAVRVLILRRPLTEVAALAPGPRLRRGHSLRARSTAPVRPSELEAPRSMNVAAWESGRALGEAFRSPEFQQRAARYPDDAVAAPHVFEKSSASDCPRIICSRLSRFARRRGTVPRVTVGLSSRAHGSSRSAAPFTRETGAIHPCPNSEHRHVSVGLQQTLCAGLRSEAREPQCAQTMGLAAHWQPDSHELPFAPIVRCAVSARCNRAESRSR
jgi:hypothetical protein